MNNVKFDGEKLKKLRLEANLTQVELAESLGIGQDQISRFEKGQEPRYTTLENMARILNVDARDLFYFSSK